MVSSLRFIQHKIALKLFKLAQMMIKMQHKTRMQPLYFFEEFTWENDDGMVMSPREWWIFCVGFTTRWGSIYNTQHFFGVLSNTKIDEVDPFQRLGSL